MFAISPVVLAVAVAEFLGAANFGAGMRFTTEHL
jgi:hypothetical protein